MHLAGLSGLSELDGHIRRGDATEPRQAHYGRRIGC
jgi:hypothetical protein